MPAPLLTARLHSVPGNSAPSLHFRAQSAHVGRHSSVNKCSRCDLQLMHFPLPEILTSSLVPSNVIVLPFRFVLFFIIEIVSPLLDLQIGKLSQINKQILSFMFIYFILDNKRVFTARFTESLLQVSRLIIFLTMFANNLQTSRIQLKHNLQSISIQLKSANLYIYISLSLSLRAFNDREFV